MSIDSILQGDPRAIARAATAIESGAPALLESLTAHAGQALLIGITGPPGAGKSTLCDQLVRTIRAEGKKVAVIAVDPTSPVTGGAILGDRIRMQQHHDDSGVFIRSMAARGWPGGVARASRDVATLLDAAGFGVVILETVGVGQAEIEVTNLAHVTVLVLAPGAGDGIQAMKAGIMEVAQVIAVNKSDLPGADQLALDLHAEANAEIVKVSALEGKGVAELWDAIQRKHR